MARNALDRFIADARAHWGPLGTDRIATYRRLLAELLATPVTEDWLAALHRDLPASLELHRDPEHGFVLQAHAEPTGLYRPPHDHGRSWVLYGVQRGESDMGTYGRVEGPDGRPVLVKRNATLVRPGEVQAYLPGDIHDTRCVAGPALLFRFTERDLKAEDAVAHRVTRYVQRNGVWTTE